MKTKMWHVAVKWDKTNICRFFFYAKRVKKQFYGHACAFKCRVLNWAEDGPAWGVRLCACVRLRVRPSPHLQPLATLTDPQQRLLYLWSTAFDAPVRSHRSRPVWPGTARFLRNLISTARTWIIAAASRTDLGFKEWNSGIFNARILNQVSVFANVFFFIYFLFFGIVPLLNVFRERTLRQNAGFYLRILEVSTFTRLWQLWRTGAGYGESPWRIRNFFDSD